MERNSTLHTYAEREAEQIRQSTARVAARNEVRIFAAIDRLDATEDEKAALRFADWGDYGDEIEEDADKAAVERLAVLRAEEEV